MGRLEKLKREMILEANRKLLKESGPLNISEGQTISLKCSSEDSGRSIDIDGRVDLESMDNSGGYSDGGIYTDNEELIPQFFVVRERGLDGGVLEGQDQTFGINIKKIDEPELTSNLGEGARLVYFDSYTNIYFCEVIHVTTQFGDELRDHGVKV